MQYFSSEKTKTYHIKSALVTFLSAFLGVLALLLAPYHGVIQNLKPEDITAAALSAGAVTVARIAVIAALTAALSLFTNKFKK